MLRIERREAIVLQENVDWGAKTASESLAQISLVRAAARPCQNAGTPPPCHNTASAKRHRTCELSKGQAMRTRKEKRKIVGGVTAGRGFGCSRDFWTRARLSQLGPGFDLTRQRHPRPSTLSPTYSVFAPSQVTENTHW